MTRHRESYGPMPPPFPPPFPKPRPIILPSARVETGQGGFWATGNQRIARRRLGSKRLEFINSSPKTGSGGIARAGTEADRDHTAVNWIAGILTGDARDLTKMAGRRPTGSQSSPGFTDIGWKAFTIFVRVQPAAVIDRINADDRRGPLTWRGAGASPLLGVMGN